MIGMKINDFYMDVLKETGNIGAGNAATALAKLLKKKITMDVPKVKIMVFSKVSELMGSAEEPVAGVLIKILGDLPGYILFIMEYKTALALADNILMMNRVTGVDLGELKNIEISVIKEVGNIVAGSYLSALASLTGLRVRTSVPGIAIDMAGAILSVPAIEYGKVSDVVLYIETKFSEGTADIKGHFILVPALESFEILMKALGVDSK
ncbi:MAG: chemotaxis protein CheC [Clostridiaceae bacterium]|nr:chemotaxis protein CheC [Clostridiaceae bacterium]